MALGNAQRHRTALKRPDLSRPVSSAMRDGLLTQADSFFDYGCGLGRVVLRAAERPFRAVVGVDNDAELVEGARRNTTGLDPARIACGEVRWVAADARTFDPPSGPAILYFNNPFPEPIFVAVLERIARSVSDGRCRPRIYYQQAFDEEQSTENVEHLRAQPFLSEHPFRHRTWIDARLTSPYVVRRFDPR